VYDCHYNIIVKLSTNKSRQFSQILSITLTFIFIVFIVIIERIRFCNGSCIQFTIVIRRHAEHRRDGCEFAMALNNNEYVNYAYTTIMPWALFIEVHHLNAIVLLLYFILKSQFTCANAM